MRSPAPIGAMVVLAALAGCGLPREANVLEGKALFVERCGGCHTLARAGTAGTTGPDLDAAFARARADGIESSTIAGIVEGQILHPRRGSAMPADLATGDAAENVAAYVARAAAVPGSDQGRLADVAVPRGGPAGRQVFSRAGCGGCHTLADAGSTATTGPDLDQVLSGRSEDFVRESIAEPDAEIATGFSAGVMPGDYESRLSQKELDQLVGYLRDVTR